MSLLLSPLVSDDAARDPAGEGTRPGLGALIGAACLPALASYLVAAVALAILTAAAGANTSVAGVARLGAAGWLAAHHVPLTIQGAPLGVLPLLPTLLLGALVARAATGVADRSGITQPVDAGWVAATIAGTHGVMGAVLALVGTPATITADPAQAAVGCALVAGIAAGLGLLRPCGLLPAALRHAPGWVRPGLEAGLWGLAMALSAGFGAVLLALVVSAPGAVEMSGPDIASAFGLIILSIAYLPNAAIAGLSWLAGPGLSVGALSISPVAVHAGPVPAVPLLAALPQGPVQPWWAAVLAVPLLIGAAVGRRCLAAGQDRSERLRVLAVAAMSLAVGSSVLGALAGGQLGAGAFDPVDVPYGVLAAALLAATLLGGAPATLLLTRGWASEPGSASVIGRADDSAHAGIDDGTESDPEDPEQDDTPDSSCGDAAPSGRQVAAKPSGQ
ncbi:MAG: cell division protein PerM [Pseudonocardiaceae bacterium]